MNANWGEWAPWSICSVSCGEGDQTRARQCNKPFPQHGGTHCGANGSKATEKKLCHEISCPSKGFMTQYFVL